MPKKEDFNEWADTPIRPMRRSLSCRSVKNLDKSKTVEKALATIPSKEIDEAKKMWSNYHKNSQRQVPATAVNNEGESANAPSSRATAA